MPDFANERRARGSFAASTASGFANRQPLLQRLVARTGVRRPRGLALPVEAEQRDPAIAVMRKAADRDDASEKNMT
jgi:hypothetical protein